MQEKTKVVFNLVDKKIENGCSLWCPLKSAVMKGRKQMSSIGSTNNLLQKPEINGFIFKTNKKDDLNKLAADLASQKPQTSGTKADKVSISKQGRQALADRLAELKNDKKSEAKSLEKQEDDKAKNDLTSRSAKDNDDIIADPQKEEASSEENGDDGGVWCLVDSSEVEAEIEKLKQKAAQLEQQVKRASDDEEREALERQLMQAKSELSLKDNEGYIKAHTKETYSKEGPG